MTVDIHLLLNNQLGLSYWGRLWRKMMILMQSLLCLVLCLYLLRLSGEVCVAIIKYGPWATWLYQSHLWRLMHALLFKLAVLLWKDYRIAGNFQGSLSREKTFANFTVLWLFSKIFSAKFGSVASFGAAKACNLRKISPRQLYFSPIYESFLPQKFPALWYVVYNSITTIINGGSNKLVHSTKFEHPHLNQQSQTEWHLAILSTYVCMRLCCLECCLGIASFENPPQYQRFI